MDERITWAVLLALSAAGIAAHGKNFSRSKLHVVKYSGLSLKGVQHHKLCNMFNFHKGKQKNKVITSIAIWQEK